MKRIALIAAAVTLAASAASAARYDFEEMRSPVKGLVQQAKEIGKSASPAAAPAEGFPYAKADGQFLRGRLGRPTIDILRGDWLLVGEAWRWGSDMYNPEGLYQDKTTMRFIDAGNPFLDRRDAKLAVATKGTVDITDFYEEWSPNKPVVGFDEDSASFTFETSSKKVPAGKAHKFFYECRSAGEAHLLCRVTIVALSPEGPEQFEDSQYQAFVKLK